MSKSIMQAEKECYITSRTDNLHKHHIYFGTGNRKISEQNGFWIWLTGELHNQDSRKDIHSDREFDLAIKMFCQKIYERTHTREEFMALIGRNYLD